MLSPVVAETYITAAIRCQSVRVAPKTTCSDSILVRVQPLMREPEENSLTSSRKWMRKPSLSVA